MKSLLASLSVVLIIVMLGAGCRTMTGKSLGENIDDTTITATVKSKLVGERAKNLTAVGVDTNQGTVYLTGNVATAAERAEAERLAREVAGVRNVVNNLRITGPTATVSPPPDRTAVISQPAPVAASPTTVGVVRHTMTGEVTKVDAGRGHVAMKTAEGEMLLHFPPAALQNVRKGDRLTVELGLWPVR